MRAKVVDAQALIDQVREMAGVSEDGVQKASENPHFSPEVRARLKVSTANALANIAVINERMGDEKRESIRRRLIAVANGTDPVWIRFRKIYELLDEMNSFNGGNVACRRGCSHCCHTQVAMSVTEAEMLGMAIGRKPKNVAMRREPGHYDAQPYGYHTPCTFLKDNECTIYEHRPLACRKLVNGDIDDLLCKLTTPPGPPVPYIDRTEFDFVGVTIVAGKDGHVKSADIREYFP